MPLLRVSDFCRRQNPQQIPICLTQTTTNNQQDDISVGYTSTRVFASLSLREGSLVFLCRPSKKVILRLKLDPSREGEESNKEPDTSFLRVAPVVATNLGLWHDSDRSGTLRLEDDCWLETTVEQPVFATSIALRPLGRCAKSWPRFFEGQPEEDDNSNWVFPPAKSLIQPSNLISVYNAKNQAVFYYEVLEVVPQDDSKNVTSASFFQTLSSTEFVLDRSPLGAVVRRLPPLLESHASGKPLQLGLPPHPNISELTRSLQHLPPSPSETVLHVIGNDRDHHVRVAVETAAHLAGMQCLSIRGLAAFAHHRGHDVRTGSLADQLAGFQAAVNYIRQERMEPCVLHIYDFETELSSIDQPMRHEQEERFWSKWMGIRPVTSRRPGEQRMIQSDSTKTTADLTESNSTFAPNMTLVLSTSSPLKPGPLMEKLVFASINLELPDLAYTKYLWEGAHWDDELIELLPGRSAREILGLRQNFLSDSAKKDTEGGVAVQKLRDCCAKSDEERRKNSSNLAQISNVHWEDVGGLAHVRREIMDAIELPLKHPHLFPKNGGRSGILLYGTW
jgi:hypothetical protein